jgi:hypothetical protein
MTASYDAAMSKVKRMADEVEAIKDSLDAMEQELNDTFKRIE